MQKRARRIKSAKSLVNRKAKRIKKYRNEIFDVIKEISVHSPEKSETDPEKPNGK